MYARVFVCAYVYVYPYNNATPFLSPLWYGYPVWRSFEKLSSDASGPLPSVRHSHWLFTMYTVPLVQLVWSTRLSRRRFRNENNGEKRKTKKKLHFVRDSLLVNSCKSKSNFRHPPSAGLRGLKLFICEPSPVSVTAM